MLTYNKVAMITLTSICFTLSALSAQAQTLDQKAWNAVWDRLAMILPANTPTESVHALRVIVPATWAIRDEEGLRELQNVASAIPEAQFSIDPSRLRLQLHKIYGNFVLDVDLPAQSKKDQAAFLAAQTAYSLAFDEYLDRLDKYLYRWHKRVEDLKVRGDPVDSQARLRFRTDMGGYFNLVQAKLDTAANNAQKFAPVANQWAQAVRRMRDEISNAQSDLRDLYGYDGGFATLTAIANDCPDTGVGWDELTFNQSVNSQNLRTSNWNGGGGWEGTFFNLNAGGSGSNYNNVITSSDENVKLRFCNLTYVPLRPGAWFDISFLQAIDAGLLKLKPTSPSKNKKILGSDGVIPRMVKGAIVARRINFEAKLGTTSLNEMRSNSGGSGGIRIGPWNIGGGGGSTQFSREYTTANGSYARSTATTVPVIIAIITEPTK
jgi:hypothetical protein